MEIMVVRRGDDYMAYVKGQSAIWGCGKTVDSAIGDLIHSHSEHFNVKIEFGR